MKFFRDNGLSIVMLALFLISIVGQIFTGLREHNSEMQQEGGQQLELGPYLSSGHFLQSTFEKWESEFLQMALFTILTMFLYQRGSSESKDPDKEEDVDREPDPNKKKCAVAGEERRHLPGHIQALDVLRTQFVLSSVLPAALVWKPERP